MSSEIAPIISAETPLSDGARNLLRHEYGFSPSHLDDQINMHRDLILGAMGRLDIALQLSAQHSLEPIQGVHESFPSFPQEASQLVLKAVGINRPLELRALDAKQFALTYDRIRHTPRKKMVFDAQLADDFLRLLGPTNPLRDASGLDAAFELGYIRNLLRKDFERLCPHDQGERSGKAELRFTEALLSEELALLWRPSALSQSQAAPLYLSEHIANPQDKNAHAKGSVGSQSEKILWRKVGIQLSEEAANLFQTISESKTAAPVLRAEAASRMIDMRLRAMQLQLSGLPPYEKTRLKGKMIMLNSAHREVLLDMWAEHNEYGEMRTGKATEIRAKFFELFCVARLRAHLFQNDEFAQFVRLATPREDRVHRDIPALITPGRRGAGGGRKIKLSADIISANVEGHLVQAFQVKHMPQEFYRRVHAEREGTFSEVYPHERIKMLFADTPGYTLPAELTGHR